LIDDDKDATNKINNLGIKTTAGQRMANRGTTVAQPSEVEVEVEKKREAPRGGRLQEEALPSDWERYCREQRPELNPKAVFESFSDYWKSVPGSKGVKLDWFLTWKNWVRRETAIPALKAKEQVTFRRAV
jgi:hypothetical protein